jgi:alcohol oxidase
LNDSADQSRKTVFARKLVILSAGALSTPQILERSGIGSYAIISSLGIKNTVTDLPGVGENYQDHNRGVAGAYRIKGAPDDTADAFIRQDPATLARWNKEYTTGQGPMAWNFVDAGSKLRPTATELATMGPDFREVWDEIYEPNPDKATISTAIAAMWSPGIEDVLTTDSEIMQVQNHRKVTLLTPDIGIIIQKDAGLYTLLP